MGTLKEKLPEAGLPSNTSQFGSDSVLGRVARGGYKMTDADIAELNKLAQTGNRAERRAATKHLKKQGISAPVAAPRQPVVAPPEAEVVQERPAKKAQPVKPATPVKKAAAAPPAAVKPAPVSAATKKATPKKAAPKKAAPKKTAVKKTTVKKAAVKKTAVKRTSVKRTSVKKAAVKKTGAKKPAKTTRKN